MFTDDSNKSFDLQKPIPGIHIHKQQELIDWLKQYRKSGQLDNFGVKWVIKVLSNAPPEGANYTRSIYTEIELLEGLKQVAPDLADRYIYEQNIMYNPRLIEEVILSELQYDLVREEQNAQILFIIVLSAKLLEKPLGAVLLGASSSGKSQLMKAIEKHFPKGIETETLSNRKLGELIFKSGFGIVNINDLTVASLCRISEQNPEFFNQKLLMMNELPEKPSDDQIQVQQILRQLISEGQYTRMITGDNREPVLLRLNGYPGFISADADQNVGEQLANRVLFLSPDESQAQTKRIQTFQGIRHSEPWRFQQNGKPSRALQVLIEKVDSITPFNLWNEEIVEHLHQRFGTKVQLRRLNDLVFRFIEVIALIRQYQRKRYRHQANGEASYLKIESEDIHLAFNLINPILEQTVSRVMKSGFLYLDMIKEYFPPKITTSLDTDNTIETKIETWFTRQELAKKTNISSNTLYPHLKKLVDAGYLLVDKKTKTHKYALLKSDATSNTDSDLIILNHLANDLNLQLEEKDVNSDLLEIVCDLSQRVYDPHTTSDKLTNDGETYETDRVSANGEIQSFGKRSKTISSEINKSKNSISKSIESLIDELILTLLEQEPSEHNVNIFSNRINNINTDASQMIIKKRIDALFVQGRIFRPSKNTIKIVSNKHLEGK
jgi:predicted transcriptional regulator